MPQSLRGQFLIAARHLRDPNFYKTVVLMVEHGADGAMGLVINRPSCVTVAHALSKHFDLPETDDLLYVGGPVEPAALFILHDSGTLDIHERPVVPGIYVGSSAEVFERVVRCASESGSDLEFRIFSGCAGWGPGQLEGELGRGDWLLQPATADALFSDDPYEMWDQQVQRAFEAKRILPHTARNPEWN